MPCHAHPGQPQPQPPPPPPRAPPSASPPPAPCAPPLPHPVTSSTLPAASRQRANAPIRPTCRVRESPSMMMFGNRDRTAHALLPARHRTRHGKCTGPSISGRPALRNASSTPPPQSGAPGGCVKREASGCPAAWQVVQNADGQASMEAASSAAAPAVGPASARRLPASRTAPARRSMAPSPRPSAENSVAWFATHCWLTAAAATMIMRLFSWVAGFATRSGGGGGLRGGSNVGCCWRGGRAAARSHSEDERQVCAGGGRVRALASSHWLLLAGASPAVNDE